MSNSKILADATHEIDAAHHAKAAGNMPVQGYQIIHPETHDCWGDRPSFEVLSRQSAIADLAAARAAHGPLYDILVIHPGDVESPTLC